MAVLKKIKFGNSSNNIAKTIVTAKSGGVMSVAAPDGVQNTLTEDADYQYELDVNVDNATIVKSSGSLAVGTVPAAQVSVADSGDLFTGTNVETVLAELDGKITSTGNVAKKYKVVAVDSPASTSQAEYKLQVAEGTSETYADVTGSSTIVVPKDNAFVTAQLGHVGATADSSTGVITDGSGADALLIEYINGSGVYTLVAVPIGSFLTESEFKDGLAVNANGEVSAKLGQGLEFGSESGENKSIKVKIDTASTGAETFLSVGADGLKISGVQDAIDTAIAALDYTDTAVAGQVVTAVSTADGIATPTKADLAGIELGGFTQDATATGAIADDDTLGDALNKLENAIDAASQAAAAGHSIVAKDANAGHLTVTPTTDQSTGATTYTIGENDIASDSDLDAEVTRAQAAEGEIAGLVGLGGTEGARTFTPTTNYGGNSASVAANMQALDTQVAANEEAIEDLQDAVGAIEYEVNGTELIFYGIPQHSSQSPEPEPEP